MDIEKIIVCIVILNNWGNGWEIEKDVIFIVEVEVYRW